MSMLYCWSCGASYKKGDLLFCPTCGKPLPDSTDLLDEINALRNEPPQYRLLRFLGGFLTIIGITMMVIAIFLAPVIYNDIYRALSASQFAIASGAGNVVDVNTPRTITFWFTLSIFSALLLFGFAWIVIAQVVQILITTYDRSRETSRLMRRLALMLSDTEGS
jgi:hypothetical protein